MLLGLLGLVVLVVVGVIVSVFSTAVLSSPRFVPLDDARFPALRSADAITARARGLGVVAALVVCAICLALMPRAVGLSVVLAPSLAALACVLVLDAGERIVGRRLAGGAAGLEVRSLRDYLPGRLTAIVLAGVVALAGAVWWGVATGDADGRTYRYDYSYVGADGPVVGNGGMSPYFGAHYAWPVALVTALLAALSVLALVRIVARPRNGTEPAIVVVDEELRRRSAGAVVATAGVGVLGSATLALFTFWSAARNVYDVVPGKAAEDVLPSWLPPTFLGLLVLALVLTVACLVRLLSPARRRLVPTSELAAA